MSQMDQLYQQLIMDHARTPNGRGLAETFDGESFQVNPTCGDKLRLRVILGDPEASRLEAVSWEGQGCSISMASTSMMSELVLGLDLVGVAQLEQAMDQMMHSRGQGISDELADLLGDAVALEGVSLYPMRIKCALLGWMALKDALIKAQAGDNRPAHVPEGIDL
ncbi:MAG: SUF system NifU family Fe-S cluster assembly protein [Micrococcales bacterium]|nr:SUF system NifU family Fe-S cluster assembly protein [Micrococcales bacterium]